MYDLHGKVALVTGAGGEHGIGRAIATRLAEEGADVIVNDVRNNPYPDSSTTWQGASSVVQEIEAMGSKGMVVVGDVADAPQVENIVEQVLQRFGHIDVLVNNAGSRPGRDRVRGVHRQRGSRERAQGRRRGRARRARAHPRGRAHVRGDASAR